jgi:hypothetical protein
LVPLGCRERDVDIVCEQESGGRCEIQQVDDVKIRSDEERLIYDHRIVLKVEPGAVNGK